MEKKEYDVVEPSYEKVKTSSKKVRTDSYFDGKFIEYIGYKLLAFLITIATLTIAKPWADKLILEYKINHTVYNGKRLKFEGKGAALFVQRFKWILLTIVTFGIYAWWIPINMEKWVVSNIHFEDEDFVDGDSYFDGKLIQLIGVNLLTYLLTLISFGLLYPFAICYKQKWIAKHTVINRKKIVFNGHAISLIGHYLLWWILSIITFGIYAWWLPLKVYGWQVKRTHIKLADEDYEKTNYLPVIIGIVLAVISLGVLTTLIPKLEIPAIISGDKSVSDIFRKKVGSKSFPGESDAIRYHDGDPVVFTLKYGNGEENSTLNFTVGDVLDTDLSPAHRDGYIFKGWIDQYGTSVGIGYRVRENVEITAIWERDSTVTETQPQQNSNDTNVNYNNPTPTQRCNDGFYYSASTNLCYSLTDYQEGYTEDVYDDAGEVIANGVRCPDEANYRFYWDNSYDGENYGFDGACYRFVQPNY